MIDALSNLLVWLMWSIGIIWALIGGIVCTAFILRAFSRR